MKTRIYAAPAVEGLKDCYVVIALINTRWVHQMFVGFFISRTFSTFILTLSRPYTVYVAFSLTQNHIIAVMR